MCKVLTAKRGGQKATGIALKAKKGGQSNQGEQKRLKLKWSKNQLRAKLTESLQLLKGEYDDKSVKWFGEKLVERLKLDEMYDKGCTDETKEWIVGHDKLKPTLNAITHIPKLISQIVLQRQEQKFNRSWIKESLMPGSNHISAGMIKALENLVRIGILRDVEPSFKGGGFLFYRLSRGLFRCLKRKKGNENEKEKKIKGEKQVVIDLTSDDSSDNFNDTNASTQKHDNNEETTVVHIGAATTTNAVLQLNPDCALTNSNDISAKKYENANVVEQPKMATPVNTTAATSTSAETTAATSTSAEPLTDSNEEELDEATWRPVYVKLMSVYMGTKSQLTDLQRLNQKLSVGRAEEEEGKKKYCPSSSSVQQSWKGRYVMLQKSHEEYKIHLGRARELNERLQNAIARAEQTETEARTSKQTKKENKKKRNKKKKKEEEKHPILRCEIPWDDLNSDLQVHLKTLNFSKRKWKDKTLPNIFDQNWDDIDDDARNAAAAFGCNKLSWNNWAPADIFIDPKLL